MTKNQINRQTMLKNVLGVLEESVSITAAVPAIARCYNGLSKVAESIDDSAVTQASRNGLAKAKATAKSQLLDVAHDVASGVVSYSTEAENEDLAARCDFSRSDLGRGRDASVVSRCRSVHAAATEVVGELADQGVTPSKLTTFKRKIDAFDTISTKPRQSVSKSSLATRRLRSLFRQASRCLSKQLDTVMVQFKTTQPEFYAKYQAARAVVSPGTRSSKGSNVVPVPGTTPVAKSA